MQAAADVRLDPQLKRGQPGLLQPPSLGRHQCGGRHVGQRRAPPQPDRLGQHLGGAAGVACGQRLPALADKRLETPRVQFAGTELKLIARSTSGQDAALRIAENAAQPEHIDTDQVRCPVRRVVAPQFRDQPVGRDRLAGVQQQRGKQRPPLWRSDPAPVLAIPDLERSQYQKPHHVAPSGPGNGAAFHRAHHSRGAPPPFEAGRPESLNYHSTMT